jgi:hypothetical protein
MGGEVLGDVEGEGMKTIYVVMGCANNEPYPVRAFLSKARAKLYADKAAARVRWLLEWRDEHGLPIGVSESRSKPRVWSRFDRHLDSYCLRADYYAAPLKLDARDGDLKL